MKNIFSFETQEEKSEKIETRKNINDLNSLLSSLQTKTKDTFIKDAKYTHTNFHATILNFETKKNI